MTIKNKSTAVEHIETLLKSASVCHNAKDLAGAILLLSHAEEQIKIHIGDEKTSPHSVHADFHLHTACIYYDLGKAHKNKSSHSALEGLAVITAISKDPMSHILWAPLMAYVPH